MAGSLLARTMASLRMYLACGLLLYVLLCSSSSVHIRRTDKGLALTSSLLPNFTHKFAIQIEAYLLALSHPSHFRHKPLGEGVEGCGWCRELGMEGGDREVGEVNGVCSGSTRGLSGGRRG